MRVFLFTLLASCVVAQQGNDKLCGVQYCNLACNGRGTCCFGTADFTDQPTYADGSPYEIHTITNLEGMYCQCKDGWTGFNCDNSMRFCDNGKNPCFNGGECVYGFEGESGYVCDCQNARDDQGIQYVGIHCEQSAPQDDTDSDDVFQLAALCNEEHTLFCLNGGRCIQPTATEKAGCDCQPGYSGNYCELHSVADSEICNKDDTLFCLNNGKCTNTGTTDDESSISCECAPGYSGKRCELRNEDVPSCTLNCLNGGECVVGFRDTKMAEYAYDPDLEPNDITGYQHCQCLIGYAGLDCHLQYQQCKTVNKVTEDVTFCFNGGTCVEPTDQNGLDAARCDCSGASDQLHSFSGSHCKLSSTEVCPKANTVDGAHFCVNDGRCHDRGNGLYDCTCPQGYSGNYCELKANTTLPPEQVVCKTECQNGGDCREGGKDFGMLNTLDGVDHLKNETYNENFEHCACPDGFTGLYCETKVEVCENSQHVCFHGSQCVADGEVTTCDCGTSEEVTVGTYCEHKATSICDSDSTGAAFCVNNGSCQATGSCLCPDGFRGVYCQIVEQSDDASPSVDKVLPDQYHAISNESIIIFASVIAVLALFVIVVTVVLTVRNQVELDTGAAKVPPATAFATPGIVVESNLPNDKSPVKVTDLQAGGSVQSQAVDEQGNDHQPEII